jgi:lactate dehydrogenase-like 2-hydroxyacid dehydrogenase
MKHDLIITAKGHKGTQERMEREFALIKLWEQPDRAAALKAAAPKIRALAHTGHSKVDAALMDALPKLEIIANFGVGVDQIDLDAAKKRGIIVTNTANVLNDCVADCAIALVLNTLRKFPQADKYLRAGRWKSDGTYPFTTSLGGKTLGILGLGRIGEEIARRAQAFKMNIRYHNRKVLDALGPQGYLVNVARGSVVDQPVLLKYLQDKKIAGAGLDVFEKEPDVPAEFFQLDNAVLLPHMASATNETRTAMGNLQIENILLHLSGKPVKTAVV